MIDLRANYNLAWSQDLRPLGEDTWEKEPFELWWERHKHRLGSLHPQIAEQWIYRHWRHSPFCHLELNRIGWRSEKWATKRLLTQVVRVDPNDEEAIAHDWALYRDRDTEPARDIRTIGTWDIPIIVIEAPNGALRLTGPDSRRFYLIEGHQRMRCLVAFDRFARCKSEHQIFILSYSEIG